MRPREHRELTAEGDDRLQGMRQMLLYNEDNLVEDERVELQILQKSDLRTGQLLLKRCIVGVSHRLLRAS